MGVPRDRAERAVIGVPGFSESVECRGRRVVASRKEALRCVERFSELPALRCGSLERGFMLSVLFKLYYKKKSKAPPGNCGMYTWDTQTRPFKTKVGGLFRCSPPVMNPYEVKGDTPLTINQGIRNPGIPL